MPFTIKDILRSMKSKPYDLKVFKFDYKRPASSSVEFNRVKREAVKSHNS